MSAQCPHYILLRFSDLAANLFRQSMKKMLLDFKLNLWVQGSDSEHVVHTQTHISCLQKHFWRLLSMKCVSRKGFVFQLDQTDGERESDLLCA